MQFVSRRNLIGNCALAVFAVLQNRKPASAQSSRRPAQGKGGQAAALVDHPRGQYSFLPGASAYSSGVVARDGYEIVHATFSRLPSLRAGFQAIDEHLSGLNLPKIALCGVELRSPRSLSLKDFGAFNASYVDVLKSWGLLLDGGVNPVARTNVAPVVFPPPEPAFYGFSYSVRSTAPQKTFIVAGAGEFGDLSRNPGDIVRRGDTSSPAIAEKTRYVAGIMGGNLRAMGVNWPDVTTIDLYTAHDLSEALLVEILKISGHNAVTWNYARPPILEVEIEMDLRGVRREIVLG
jgi:hypothetical protein